MPKQSLGQEMYSGTAKFGRVMAIIGAVVATLIGIGLIIFGGILTTHKTQFSASVQGTVIDSSMCVPTNNDDGSVSETCMVAVHYNVGSQCKTMRDSRDRHFTGAIHFWLAHYSIL